MGDGVPTIGGLKRLTYLPDREADEEQGLLIAGQEYFDVYFTGGEIRNTNIVNATITTPIFASPISLANGGTGANLTPPGDDRIMFWDQSANQVTWLTPGSGLVITGTTMTVAGVGLGDVTGPMGASDNAITRFDGATGKIIQNSLATIDDSGNISATNLSGTNTGDQTITLTGPVTGSGTGSFVTTITPNAVTNSIIRQSAGLSVIGRSTNTTGDVADITAGTDNQVLRRSGTVIGFGAIALNQSAAVTGSLGIANGGTGATTVSGAKTALGILPPTFQYLTASGTYNTPANCTAILIEMAGAGGGGGGYTTGSGGDGGNTTFNSIVANGGKGGSTGANTAGGPGDGGRNGTGAASERLSGNPGGASAPYMGAPGGAHPFFGSAGFPGTTNGTGKLAGQKGAGGAGESSNNNNLTGGHGGGSGEAVRIYINSPASTYSFTIGTAGTAGGGGTAGGAGYIRVTEYY